MELNGDIDKEYDDSAYYGQDLYNNKELCLICYVDETEEGKQWTRYKTKCGHIFHTRCFRRWCGVKNCINCSYCGDIPEIKQNRFCIHCDKFGHAHECGDVCPFVKKINDGIYPRTRKKQIKPLITFK